MSDFRLNAYRIMWLFVFFDLPTTTKKHRRDAAHFRKDLEKDGFVMMQFSVYSRHCASKESLDVHMKRVRRFLPSEGQVTLLNVTDRQYGEMVNYWGKIEKALPDSPQQLELF
jgi:CRISPR-associated protein Cas2